LDGGLADLRRCRDAEELAARACLLALSCCGADRAALGRVRDGVWSPWRHAATGDAATPLVPRVPTALEELPTERDVVRDGRPAVRGPAATLRRRAGAPATGSEVVVVAGVRSGGRVVGLLHVAAADGSDPAIVGAFADALSSMFALLDARDRARGQARVFAALGRDVGRLLEDDPIELVPGLGSAEGAGPATAIDAEAGAAHDGLTPRQREVLELLLAGLSNAQIAERLVLAVPTVKSHVRAVLRAVGAVNRSEAVARFARDGAGRPTG
jgi:DNA-binding CsgD family transcriptional regulator